MFFPSDFCDMLQIMKIEKKHAFLVIVGVDKKGSMGIKSRDTQKAHLGPLLNVPTYLVSATQLNLEGSYARNKLRKDRKRPKNYFFRAVTGWNGDEKSRPQKNTEGTY